MKNEKHSRQGINGSFSMPSITEVFSDEIRRIKEEREIQDEVESLRSQLEKLRQCFEKRLLPTSQEWPSRGNYRHILTSVTRVDHLWLRRKRAHPFWRYAQASVNRRYPEIRLALTIQSFVEYASEKMPSGMAMPESLGAFEATLKKRLKGDSSYSSKVFALSEIAFEIYKGKRKATGNHVEGLVQLCPEEFRKLCPQQLNDPAHIPKEWHRLVEFAAALEIVRIHQAYGKEHVMWMSAFSGFLLALGNPEFHKIETRLSFFNSDRTDGFQKREQANERKRRQRQREKEKK
jgi:hypothetical protein